MTDSTHVASISPVDRRLRASRVTSDLSCRSTRSVASRRAYGLVSKKVGTPSKSGTRPGWTVLSARRASAGGLYAISGHAPLGQEPAELGQRREVRLDRRRALVARPQAEPVGVNRGVDRQAGCPRALFGYDTGRARRSGHRKGSLSARTQRGSDSAYFDAVPRSGSTETDVISAVRAVWSTDGGQI